MERFQGTDLSVGMAGKVDTTRVISYEKMSGQECVNEEDMR